MPSTTPVLTLQAASLYASGEASTFTGTGGPFGFSPFTGQFGGPITSAGLAAEPFNDTVYSVSAGDDLTFVIAVQNTTPNATAYSVRIKEALPTGFVVPTDGLGLTVTDGLGNDLSTSGDLFGAAGLLINAPLAGYDASSGQNIDLITFSLDAGVNLPGPYATIAATARLAGYSAAANGPDLSATHPASATTTIVTPAPTPVVTPESDPTAVATGQTIAFDVTVTVPTGTLPDFQLAPMLPTGITGLQLVSSAVLSTGSALQLGTPTIASDGSIHFGNVTRAATAAGSDTIVARIVVRAEGSASGVATLQTAISASDPAFPGGRWTANVSSGVGVVVPPPPPILSGLGSAQTTVPHTPIDPFAKLTIQDANPAQQGTMAITLLDPSLGALAAPSGTAGSVDPTRTVFVATGSLAALQAAARALAFTPAALGTARFTITVVDAAGGVAQDGGTAVAVAPPPLSPEAQAFDAAYYLAHNPDVAAAGLDPLQHFEAAGWREGRNPSASFDTNDYLAANPDVKAAAMDPLAHYTASGKAEGRAAFAVPSTPSNPLVDAAYYLAHNPDVRAAGIDPTAHYLASGYAEGRNPDAFFDSNYYLTQNPDVRAAGIDPLLHFMTSGWKEGREPSLMFDDTKYLAQNPDVRAAGLDPLLHYLASGQSEGRAASVLGASAAPDPLVNAGYYDAQLGATLIPSGTAGAAQAAAAYDQGGWQKGLNPDAVFNTAYYLQHNPDVAAAHIDPLAHYENAGWKEGRDPSAQFSTHKYLGAYPDIRNAGIDPLLHYVQSGQAESRQAFAV